MHAILLAGLVTLAADTLKSPDCFVIQVVDQATRRGVPLVELRTVHDLAFYTDSQGIVAFQEPGLMDRDVYFRISSHGYQFRRDGFGFAGQRLRTTPGTRVELTIERINIAERLYRITGGGIYAESERAGLPAPLQFPLLNSQVLGSDSVQDILFRGRIHWFWGDTNRLTYPLGNFHVPGATSRLPGDGGLAPDVGINLEYFVDPEGFAKSTCRMPGSGPTWIDGLVVLGDEPNSQRLFAHYLKVKPPLTVYEQGIAEFDPQLSEFRRSAVFPAGAACYPSGHTFLTRDAGRTFAYFAKPFPLVRVPAAAESLVDIEQYEAFTCLAPGSTPQQPVIERSPTGQAVYGFKRRTPPLTLELHSQLLRDGQLESDEAIWNLCDSATGKPVRLHNGSLYWNDYRQAWILIASEIMGTSMLGEVWYAESDAPFGPWSHARKIVTHDKQSFYNPKQHPVFAPGSTGQAAAAARAGGQFLYFEGTYTHSFSGNPERTPRYEYNQIMYRLDLADPRLVLPAPVYRTPAGRGETLSTSPPSQERPHTYLDVVFLACRTPLPGFVELHGITTPEGTRLTSDKRDGDPAAFRCYVLPAALADPPPLTALLYEITSASGERRYATGDTLPDGWQRADRPLCRVWVKPPSGLAPQLQR
ncbi:MAG: hypothetical protein AB7F89_06010 [Pirellulaceae bacterium]